MRIEASYIEHPDPELNDNPLTEAIQPILSAQEIKRLISFTPKFSEDFHDLPRLYKNLNIRRIAEIFVAPSISVMLYDKIVELILDGYRYRNPLSVSMTRFQYELAKRGGLCDQKEDQRYKIIPPGMTTAPGVVLSGPSGSGKTSTTRATLGIIPKVITHSGYKNATSFQQDQIVWVSYDAPSTPSPKALCLNFLRAVDEALGVDRYYPEFSRRSDSTSVDQHFLKVQEIATNHYIGLMHLDEMQFFLSYANVKNAPNLQVIEALFNKLGIPVLLSTTDGGLPLIDANEQTKRRVISEKQFRLSPLKPGTNEFKNFINSVFLPSIWPDPDVLRNQRAFIAKFHYLSAGLPAVMIRLARLHLFYCVSKGCSPFDIKELESVFNSQFEFMKDSLARLRVGDLKHYEISVPKDGSGRAIWCQEEAGQQDGTVSENHTTSTELASVITRVGNNTKNGSKRDFHNPKLIGDV